jgi:hypothetical protein
MTRFLRPKGRTRKRRLQTREGNSGSNGRNEPLIRQNSA